METDLTPVLQTGHGVGVLVRIKNRSQASGWWNGKGVVMSAVRCYLRVFCAGRGGFWFGHGFSFWILDWLILKHTFRCSGSHFSFCIVISGQ